MEPNDKTPMTPLDTLVSSQELQTLKMLIPYTPPANQSFLAVYVKFMELQRTMSVFQTTGKSIHIQGFDRKAATPADMINDIKPYLPKDTSETIDNLLNMMNMMEMISNMQNTNAGSGGDNGGMNPMDMMQGMLTPEQRDMYEMYSTMFENTSANTSDKETDMDNNTDDASTMKGQDTQNGYEFMDE